MPTKSKKKSSQNQSVLSNPIVIIAIIGAVVVGLILYQRYNMAQVPANLQTTSQNPQTTYTQNTYTQNYYTQTLYTQVNNRAPTSLTALVSPDPVRMGGWVLGTVSSNGYNYPITVLGTHQGSNEQVSLAGFLGPDGKWQLTQQMNTPGRWRFYAFADNGVTSNIAQLTCEGIDVNLASSTYSKSMMDSLTIGIYSHLSGNCQIIANDPAHAVSYDVTNAVVNAGGYGSVGPSLDFLPNGSYEIDARIGSEWAHDYGGTAWITVGR